MVMSKLDAAMEMKPVRSNLLLPALSIRKNLKGKNNTVVTLLTFFPLFETRKWNIIRLRLKLLNHLKKETLLSLIQDFGAICGKIYLVFLKDFTDKTVEFILSSR